MKKKWVCNLLIFFDPPTWKCACRSHFPLSTSKFPSVGAVVVQLVRTQNDEMKGEMLRRRTEITGWLADLILEPIYFCSNVTLLLFQPPQILIDWDGAKFKLVSSFHLFVLLRNLGGGCGIGFCVENEKDTEKVRADGIFCVCWWLHYGRT